MVRKVTKIPKNDHFLADGLNCSSTEVYAPTTLL